MVYLLFCSNFSIVDDFLFLSFRVGQCGGGTAPIMSDIGHNDVGLTDHVFIALEDDEAPGAFLQKRVERIVVLCGVHLSVQIGQDQGCTSIHNGLVEHPTDHPDFLNILILRGEMSYETDLS